MPRRALGNGWVVAQNAALNALILLKMWNLMFPSAETANKHYNHSLMPALPQAKKPTHATTDPLPNAFLFLPSTFPSTENFGLLENEPSFSDIVLKSN